jgi:hypothetical protein
VQIEVVQEWHEDAATLDLLDKFSLPDFTTDFVQIIELIGLSDTTVTLKSHGAFIDLRKPAQ